MLFTSGGSTSPNSHISTVSPNNDQSPNQGDRSGRSTPSSVESSGNTLSITTEPIVPGQWTNVNSKVRIKQLTVSETKAIFALQKSHQEERRVSISATFKAPEVKETKLEKPMEETSESGTTTGGTKRITTTSETIHHRIPDSPGSRSNYGEFYWDTNGENNYHPSDSFDSDLMLELDALEGRGLSTARLDRTHDDLNKYKQRIDANVEQQREYSEMMAALQQKVQEYRKHIAELEGKMVSQRARHGQDPSSFSILDSNVLTDIRYGAGGAPIGGDTNISHTNIEMWTPSRKFLDTTGDSNANFEIIARLDEERRRNDDYRTQLENERQQNNQLQHQIENLRVDYDRDVREKERHYQNREKNLALYLSEEQKKMLDLWAEVQRMRRHFADLKEQTERDLENQKNDFTKAYRTLTGLTRSFSQGNIAGLGGLGGMGGHGGMGGMGGVGGVGGVVGGLSGLGGYGGTDTRDLISQPLLMSGDGGGGSTTVNINHDTVLYETVRRLQERGGRGGAGSNLAADLQLLTQLRSQGGGAGDAELHNELMKKYEESIERNIELESKGDDCQRKIAEMEAELRRTRDRLNDNQNALRKLHDLAQDVDKSVSDGHKRTRSLSPGPTPLPPSEALRTVRNALRTKDNENQQLERKLKIAEKQISEFMSKFENADEQRRKLDKRLADEKRENANIQKVNADIERQLRKLEDKTRNIEAERNAAEKARKILEEELHRLQSQFHKNTSDDIRKAREEAEEATSNLEEDYKNRIAELNRRIDALQRENTRIKSEFGPLKDKFRDMEIEYTSLIRRIEEKDAQVKHLEDVRRNLIGELEKQKELNDAMRAELDRLHGDYETVTKTTTTTEQTVKELKTQRDDYLKQRDDLTRQIFDLKHKLESEIKAHDDADRATKRVNDDIDKHKETITDLERQILLLRRHNDELDTQIKSGQAKSTTVENELVSNTKEIERLNELNQKLQKEKQDTLNQKHKVDSDVAVLKEQVRKLEIELDKLRNENKSITVKEEKARDAMNQQINRAHNLQKELEEAREEIKALQKRLHDLDLDFKEYRERIKGGNGKGRTLARTHDISSGDADFGRGRDIGGGPSDIGVGAGGIGAGGAGGAGGGAGGTGTGSSYGLRDGGAGGIGAGGIGGVGDGADGRGGSSTYITDEYDIDGGRGGGAGGAGVDRYYDSHIAEVRIKEINDKWRNQVEKLENEKDDLERRIRELEDEIAHIGRGTERNENDIAELKRRHQSEIDRLKQEIDQLNDKHQNELDDEKENYTKNLDSLKALEDEMRDKLTNTEKRLADALNNESEYQRERRDYDDKINTLFAQNQKLRDDLEEFRSEADKEIQKWKTDAYSVRSELKSLETSNATLKAQLQAANERSDTLNKTVNDLTNKIRELNSQVRRLEEELADAKSLGSTRGTDLDSAQNRLRQLEEQYAALQLDSSKWRNELDTILRENDQLKSTNNTLESDLNRLKKRLQTAEQNLRDQKGTLDHLRSERDRLQNAFREKAKQADHLNQLSQQFDSKLTKMRTEIKETSEKLINSDTERNNLKNELSKLQQELDFGKEQMHRKNDEFQSTLDDLSNSHRSAEDGRLNALQELESRKYELADANARLENAEQRLITLQQEYIIADSERDALADALRRFQATANRIVNVSRFKTIIDGGVGGDGTGVGGAGADGVGGPGSVSDITGGASYGDPRSFDSGILRDSSEDSPYKSVPFPASSDYGMGGAGGPGRTSSTTTSILVGVGDRGGLGGVGGGIGGIGGVGGLGGAGGPGGPGGAGGAGDLGAGAFDMSHLDNTLQALMTRIERLERERTEYREALNRLKKKTSDTHTTITKRETRYKTIEENLTDVEDEKRALEARLLSAKQLLRSQEEQLQQRSEERRQMKSKMVAAELQARGKEAQVRHLNEQLKNLRTDLDNAHSDVRQLRDHEESWDASRYQLESKLRDKDSEVQMLKVQVTSFETEKTNLTERVKELEGQLRLSDTKCSDMKDDMEKMKRDIMKSETIEIELRKTMDEHSRVNTDYSHLKEQLTIAQNDLLSANTRKQQLENELMGVRTEMREYKTRITDMNNRVSDLQRQLQDANSEKHRLDDRLISLEKTVQSQRTQETELRQQLESAKNDRKEKAKELNEIKLRLAQLEADRRNYVNMQDQWKREKITLIKKIEMLESDKRRTDAAIRETALQREAIEKSLNAMERENRELYKNCAQLQQQIAQLEMENGNRIVELTNKQREEQERQLHRMRSEKAQVEKIIESRDRTHQNRIKQLEDQLRMMRDQLDAERRRRREYVDRTLVGDMSRLGPNLLGLKSGYMSAGILPSDNIDSLGGTRYIRSTFASNPLTPPLGSSTPTHSARYMDSSVHRDTHSVDPKDTSYGHHETTSTGTSKYETLAHAKDGIDRY